MEPLYLPSGRITMESPSDVFPALFAALRDRLTVHEPLSHLEHDTKHAVENGEYSTPITARSRMFSSPCDALLSQLSAADRNVQRSIQRQIRADTSAAKLQLLRHKRAGIMKAREAKRAQTQRLNAMVTCECEKTIQDAITNGIKFEQFVVETHTKATARLQTLFFECIAEMKKALARMENIAADSTNESESRVDELRRYLEWQVFVTRIQQDCGGDVQASLLVPEFSHADGSLFRFGSLSSGQTSNSNVLEAALRKILEEHGPSLENGQSLEVQSVISLSTTAATRRVSEKSRSTPSLHFGTSASELLMELLTSMIRSPSPIKSQRSAPSGPSSSTPNTRRIRRLPPSTSSLFLTCGGKCSTLRQLTLADTPQFPGSACDVPLSSVYIRWMLPIQDAPCALNSGVGSSNRSSWQGNDVADSSIYFNVAEYEQNFAAVMQNYATSAAMDYTLEPSPVDQAVLASARRSLREVSAILERSQEQKEAYAMDTIFAPGCVDNSNEAFDSTARAKEDHCIFVRASVLQLVQTIYYARYFLSLLPPNDVGVLKKLYPTALFGEGCLSTLYIPVRVAGSDGESAGAHQPKVYMQLLDDHIIHELLLVYVTRGRHNLERPSSQQLTSLAFSDAMNTLVSRRQTDSHHNSARFCSIKNPRGLWKQDKTTGAQGISLYPDELERVRDTEAIFIECVVTTAQFEKLPIQQSIAHRTKTHDVLEILNDGFCMWRSCLASRATLESSTLSASTNLCQWHSATQRTLEIDDSLQYVPNERRMGEVFLAAEGGSIVERAKSVIKTSSQLLEELSSRHLVHSIEAFFEHVNGSASNCAYEKLWISGAADSDKTEQYVNNNALVAEVESSHHELQHLVAISEKILSTELFVTGELQQLLQLTVYPGVEDSFLQHGFFDVEELQSDIHTRDLDLILLLSQKKLQILQRRRKDEEKLVGRRLTPSTSLSGNDFHAALERAGSVEPELGSSSVYDVIHVMRKGRQSLLRQQNQNGIRSEPKRSGQTTRSLDRSASDHSINPYEAKLSPVTKHRANGGNSGRRAPTKVCTDEWRYR